MLQVAWTACRPIVVAAGAAAVIAVLVALAIVLTATPVYQAETNVSIRPRVADLGTAEAAARLVRNYAVWVDSEAYAARLSAEDRGGLSPAEIAGKVRARGDGDRLLVTIQSEDDNPQRAADLVNGLAALLVDEVVIPARVDDPEKGLEVSVIDWAKAPTSPVWPRAEIVLPLGAVIGAFVGGALAWLLRGDGSSASAENGSPRG